MPSPLQVQGFPVSFLQHLPYQWKRITIVDRDILESIKNTPPFWPGIVVEGHQCLEINCPKAQRKVQRVTRLQHSQLVVLDAAAWLI